MIAKVFIQNLKCGGCAKSIETVLNTIDGVDVLNINDEEDYVEFEYKTSSLKIQILNKLKKIGYPPKGEDNNISFKAKSVVSCIRGRFET